MSAEPHPGYGPCDGMGPGGQCSECCGITDGEVKHLRTQVAATHAVQHEQCHDLVCNGDRRQPVGAKGHGCSCVGRSQRLLEETNKLTAQISATHAAIRALRDECVPKVQWVRKFVEYARYVLEPGVQQFGDQFPRQDAADKAMAELDIVLARLLGDPAQEQP